MPKFSFGLERKVPFTETVNSVNISLSAYDIPTALEGYEDDSGILHISFRYCDDEPGVSEPLPGGIEVVRGEYSRKILALRLPVRAEQISRVHVEVDMLSELLESSSAEQKQANSRMNQRLISQVLKSHSGKIEKELTGS